MAGMVLDYVFAPLRVRAGGLKPTCRCNKESKYHPAGMSITAVTVYCSASSNLDPDFHGPALLVGREIARRGLTLVYGGGKVGLMGEIGRAARAAGGCTVGVITKTLMSFEQGDEQCDELIIVDSMRERKTIMAQRGDGFLVLPGGLGTYEEFFEILVGRHLGEHAKPIAVVNSHGYFNPLIAMVEHGIEHRFFRPAMRDLFFMHPEPAPAIEWICDSQRG
jgi:uncharacterized protein (TIGR00730 family)